MKERTTTRRHRTLATVCVALLLAAGATLARNDDYDRGRAALDRREWGDAVEAFDAAARAGGDQADAALYWQAYALSKLGLDDRALAVLDRLERDYPRSRWIDDARVLEGELRGDDSDADDVTNEDLKLAALTSLVHTDPKRAMPYLEKLIDTAHGEDTRSGALFLLLQTGLPEASDLATRIARGERGADVELRVAAIHALGVAGGPSSAKLLDDIYRGGASPEVKEAVLQTYMMSGRKERLLEVAGTERDAELRQQAVMLLGTMGQHETLWKLYQSESDLEVKKAILNGLAVGGGRSYLEQIATKSGENRELRVAAIHGLGIAGGGSPDVMIDLFSKSTDEEIQAAALDALAMRGDATRLVELARRETDPRRKKSIVERLMMTRSKEATDYLMELLDE